MKHQYVAKDLSNICRICRKRITLVHSLVYGDDGCPGEPPGLKATSSHYNLKLTVPQCQCGSEKVGSPSHSPWCPKAGGR